MSGGLAAVELGHLELVLEVRDRAQSLDDRTGRRPAGEVDDQDVERLGADVAQMGGRVVDERDALVGVEQRAGSCAPTVDDRDDDLVEQLGGAGDDVEVPVGDRVVAAGADGDAGIRCHGCGSGCRRSGARSVSGKVEARAARAGRSRRPRAPPGASTRRQRRAPARAAPRRGTGGRGRPDRMGARPRCVAEERASTSPRRTVGVDPRAPRGWPRIARSAGAARSTKVAAAGPARQRLDAQARPSRRTGRARAAPSIGAEDREQRLAHPVGGRAGGAPRRRGERRPPRLPAITRTGTPTHPGHSTGVGACGSARGLRAVGGRAARRRAARARARRARGRRRGSARRAPRARSSSSASSGSRATRNWASPDWRVPTSSPSPRSSRSISASRKPSVCAAERLEAGATPSGRTAGTARRARPRPTRPRSWCSWRDAVALGVLDEHHGRVGDVDADLDHRRGDEHVGAAGGERRHRLLLLARAHLAVQQHDAEVARARSSRSRSYSAVAARACSASDSSTSGQTTNAWRPARSSSRMRS